MTSRNAQKRGAETREAQLRKAPGTRHTGKLHVPPEIVKAEAKKGYGVRWIALSVHNQPLDGNVESRLMNGWMWIEASEYPQLVPPTLPGREKPTMIQRGAQILCRKLQKDIDADQAEGRAENMAALNSVNWDNKDNKVPQLGSREVIGDQVVIERVSSSNAGFKE